MSKKFLKLPEILRARGRSRSSHYLDVRNGFFTRPVVIGRRSVAWPEYELDILNAARLSGLSDDEVRALVTQLEAARNELKPKLDNAEVLSLIAESSPFEAKRLGKGGDHA